MTYRATSGWPTKLIWSCATVHAAHARTSHLPHVPPPFPCLPFLFNIACQKMFYLFLIISIPRTDYTIAFYAIRWTKLDPLAYVLTIFWISSNLYDELLFFYSNLCVYRLTVVTIYVYNNFHFVSICVYECMICFVHSNLYLICGATYMYNR